MRPDRSRQWFACVLAILLIVSVADTDLPMEACTDDDGPFVGVFNPDDLTYRHVYFLASSAPAGKAALRFGSNRAIEHGGKPASSSLTIMGSYAYPHGLFGTAEVQIDLFTGGGCMRANAMGVTHHLNLQNTSAAQLHLTGPDVPDSCTETFSATIQLLTDNGESWLALAPLATSECFDFRMCCMQLCDVVPQSLCTTRDKCIENGHGTQEGAVCPKAGDVCCAINPTVAPSSQPAPDNGTALGLYILFVVCAIGVMGGGVWLSQRRNGAYSNTDDIGMHTL